MDFVKMEGLGNDFVVVDAPYTPDADEIRRWCHRRFGIGADGVLQIAKLDRRRIGMRYWNADGGEAEMCGNGLRCLARLAVIRGWVDGPSLVVETAVGPLTATVLDDGSVRAVVGEPEVSGPPITVGSVLTHPISVGNPHAVVFVDDPAEVDLPTVGRRIEHDPQFPDRTNVEFVAIEGLGAIRARIWERGVGETTASGTGCTAAAYAAIQYRDVEAPLVVHVPGGTMTVELEGNRAWMIGPANLVYSGTLP